MNEVQRQQYRGNEAALAWRAEVGTAGGDEGAVSFEQGANGITAWFIREAAAAWAACRAFEWVALGYLAISSALIAVFGGHLARSAKLIGVQALVAAMILVLCLLETRGAKRAEGPSLTSSMKFGSFLRHWYPQLLFV